jgi:hypothetical protein
MPPLQMVVGARAVVAVVVPLPSLAVINKIKTFLYIYLTFPFLFSVSIPPSQVKPQKVPQNVLEKKLKLKLKLK